MTVFSRNIVNRNGNDNDVVVFDFETLPLIDVISTLFAPDSESIIEEAPISSTSSNSECVN